VKILPVSAMTRRVSAPLRKRADRRREALGCDRVSSGTSSGAGCRRGTVQRGALVLALLAVGGCWNGSEADITTPEPTEQVLQAGPEVRYVSPDGDDEDEGTRRAPWETLRHALTSINPGQVLYVREGTYREDLRKMSLNQGSEDERVLVQAYPGDSPLVRGLVWLRQPSYWTIDGLDVTWDTAIAKPPPHMVKVTGGVGWTWANSRIWGAVEAANVFITGWENDEPADWEFVGNCVHDPVPGGTSQRGSNLTVGDMGPESGPGLIERNLLFGVENGRNLTLGFRRGPDQGGPTDVDVWFNTLYDSYTAIAVAGDTSDVSVERNILGDIESLTFVRSKRLAGAGGVRVQVNLGLAPNGYFEKPEFRQRLRFFQTPEYDGKLGAYRSGNTIVDDVSFEDTTTCGGFTTTNSVALPYGRDGIG